MKTLRDPYTQRFDRSTAKRANRDSVRRARDA